MKSTTLKRAMNALATLLATGAVLVLMVQGMQERADAASGKNDFSACAACHSVTGREGVGPHLNGVIGRKAGSVSGFNYSPAMKQANIVWNDETLDAFLADPQSAVPGHHMPFSGMQDATQRADIIAYLNTLR